MDASNRSCHVYGKTQSGKSALNMARGALSSAARQLLILIDGQRTVGDLSSIVGAEALERSLERLETQGYVELVRHFPEVDEGPKHVAASLCAEVPVERTLAARRQRSGGLIVLGLLVAIVGVVWLLVRGSIEWANPNVAAGAVAQPAPQAVAEDGMSAAPALKTPEGLPAQVRNDPPRVPARTNDRPLTESKPESRVGAAQQVAKLHPETAATPVPSEPPPTTANPARLLHVRSQVPPQIPQQAKDLGIKAGRVVVILHVSPNGTVERVELVSATPPQVYDEEMQRTFEKWTFDPPGTTGRMTVQVDVVPQNESEASLNAGPASDDR